MDPCPLLQCQPAARQCPRPALGLVIWNTGTMTTADTDIRGRLLLVSAPWPLFNRPSLPLGVLKAYLSTELPSVDVETSHLFLKVANALGYDCYQNVSRRVWRAESICSALLYPEHAHKAESLYRQTVKRGDDAPADFQGLVNQVEKTTDRWVQQIDWTTFDLVGFTVSFCQVTASLYLISRIKAICSALPVVVGGSSFSGERSADLLKIFPFIDYLVIGEGERPLSDLLRFLLAHQHRETPAIPPRSIYSAGTEKTRVEPFCQLKRLDRLTTPDYDDYFKTISGFSPSQRFFPTLPVEASRGCWWHRKDHLGQFSGCAFCNLNLQWQGYRTKPAQQVIREVDHLVQRHQVLSIAFSDNAFPVNRIAPIFDGLQQLSRDLSIFAELRANTPSSLLRKMKQAGVDTVQVGIEALSGRLLSKMNKGVRVIDNLNMMKHCEAAGIVNASNLMLHFPSSDSDDIHETLRTLEYAQWYHPLKSVSFWLGLESPVHRFARRFNIRATFNHPNLKKLFPKEIAAAVRFIIQGYRGDRTRQRQLWRPVETKLRQWHNDYFSMQRRTRGKPALMFRDGERFILISQCFPDQETIRHRLTGISADIYRFCTTPQRLDQITEKFISHRPEQIEPFLKSMVAKRLMFNEQDSYLSLAVPFAGVGTRNPDAMLFYGDDGSR